MFDQGTVRTILEDHYSRKEINDTLIWSLLIFQTWFDLYMDRRCDSPFIERTLESRA
jgi:hypothetical protein